MLTQLLSKKYTTKNKIDENLIYYNISKYNIIRKFIKQKLFLMDYYVTNNKNRLKILKIG